jgi:hypothetical protein
MASLLLLLSPGEASKHEHFGDGFSIDLNNPSDEVVRVVQEVADDGIIRGTFEYKGTSQLDRAFSAKKSNAFPVWTGGGTVVYKLRPNSLAPENFHESNDKGTVVVRYVVVPVDAKTTRLRIDALFQEDSHHHTHLSNGQVENSEFEAIAAKIKDLEELQERQRQQTARQEQLNKLAQLQAPLAQERTQLKAAIARQQQLQNPNRLPESNASARIVATSADLKVEPYNQSRTLQTLSQGDSVTILLRTTFWVRVRTTNGTQGWIYTLMLGAPQ